MPTPLYYIVSDEGTATWTNDHEVAAAAAKDGASLVIDVKKATYTFDSDSAPIDEADRDEYIEEEDEDDGEGEDD